MEYSKYQLDIFDWIKNGSGNAVIDAKAGAAKTTTLVKSMDFIDKDSKVLFLAYNKAIAEELRTRVSEHIHVRTLHSLGWSVINKYIPDAKLENKKTYHHIKKFFDDKKIVIKNFGDRIKISNNIRKLIEYYRYALIDNPSEQLINEIISKYDITILNNEQYLSIPIYESFLNDHSCYDFADMLFEPLYRNMPFPQYDWVFLDEVQDVSSIQKEMFLRCMHPKSRFLAAGDPFQCLLPDTIISTADGDKKIQDIRANDNVISYFSGLKAGQRGHSLVTEISKNNFNGSVYTIETESGKKITGTSNHITFANYSKEFKSSLYCLYLMFKSDFGYRIGISKTCGSKAGNNFGFKSRLAGEGAQKIWVLKVYEKEAEARLDEILFSLKYSIPTTTFNVHVNTRYNNLNDKNFIAKVFSSIDTRSNVRNLFSDLDLFEEYPHFINKSSSTYRKSNVCINMCVRRKTSNAYHELVIHVKDNSEQLKFLNQKGYKLQRSKKSHYRLRYTSINFGDIQKIIDDISTSDLFEFIYKATLFKKTLDFCPFSHVRRGMIIYSELNNEVIIDKVKDIIISNYSGPVYDINLDRHHNYVANGVLVHNCLYAFRGASKTVFSELQNIPNTITLPLSISYRCGKNIISHAQKLVPNIEHFEKNPDGEVILNGSLNNVKYGDVILCRTNAPLAALANKLLQEHKKVTIVGNDFSEHLQDIIESSKKVYCRDLFVFLDEKADKILKKIVEANNCVDPQEDPDYVNFLDKSTTIKTLATECDTVEQVLSKIKKIFSSAPDSSGITLSTVHRAKGREWDHVFIVEPQLIPFPYYLHNQDSIDTENNVDYVARTRAKLKLEYITDWSYENAKSKIQKKPLNTSNTQNKEITVPRDADVQLTKKKKKKKLKTFS